MCSSIIVVFLIALAGSSLADNTAVVTNTLGIAQTSIDLCPTPVNGWATLEQLCYVEVHEPAFLLNTVKKTISFPCCAPNSHDIACLKITNLDPINNGGTATIISGGYGHKSAIIQLESSVSQRLDYKIEIYRSTVVVAENSCLVS